MLAASFTRTVSSSARFTKPGRLKPGQLEFNAADILLDAIFSVRGFLLLFLMVALWGVPGTAAAADNIPRDPMEYFFHQSFNNLDEELEIAVEENKTGVFIMFSDKDCPWCLKMKSTIMNRADVQDYYREHFRILTVDIRGDTLMTDFEGNELAEKDFAFKQHRVRATPVFMFFDTSGKRIMRLTGIVRNAREFIWLGEFVVSGEYQNTNFTRYKRARAKQAKAVSLNNQH